MRAEEVLSQFRVRIFYAPVGYVVLPNGECYWFFLKRTESAEGWKAGDAC